MARRLFFGFVVSWILLGWLSSGVVEARCAAPRVFTGVNGLTEYSYIYTPGYPHANARGLGGVASISDGFDGIFWSFGGGDPALSAGNDMGAFGPFVPTGSAGQYYAWLYPGGDAGSLLYPAMIYNPGGYNNWADPRVSGCIDEDGDDPFILDDGQCMIILLTDQIGGVGYFSLLAQRPDGIGNYKFNEAANNERILLTAIPRPTILESTRTGGAIELTVNVDAPDPAEAVFLNCRDAAQNDAVLTGYDLFYQLVPPGVAPPHERSIDGLVPAGVAAAIGNETTFVVDCTEEQDLYLCASLSFESGFATQICSEDTEAVQCGPIAGDADNDGIPDEVDNCPLDFNPNQADSDGDGVGDACEVCEDDDGDGFGFPGDSVCPAGSAEDCDDQASLIFPGASEVYDGVDNDCDGQIDQGLDTDGDGIPNFRDLCSGTPSESGVDPNGCAVCFPGSDDDSSDDDSSDDDSSDDDDYEWHDYNEWSETGSGSSGEPLDPEQAAPNREKTR